MKPADRITESGLVPHGRTPHTATLDALLSDAARGHGGAVVPVGDIGTGKSALPDTAARAAAGLRVLRATGVESEARLPYAGLHVVLREALHPAGRLPRHQLRLPACPGGPAGRRTRG